MPPRGVSSWDSVNRTERLYALVEELRARAPRPLRAVDLAERFDVSIRTIERDLIALQQAGVPIWARRGPSGGYGLNKETTLPPLNLTPAEAAAVATALAAGGTTPFAEAGRSAMRKLANAMAAASKDAAAKLVSQIRIVPGPATGASPAGVLRPESRLVDVIQRALIDSVAVELSYRDARGRESVRVVEPAGLFSTPHGWYLAAWCRRRRGARAFRLDRMVSVRLTAEPVAPRSLDAMLKELPYDLAEPALT